MTEPALDVAPPVALSSAELRTRADHDLAGLDRELAEIELLIQQARAEAVRHEAKRALGADRVAAFAKIPEPDLPELIDLNAQLVTLTKRAGLMDAQVEVLEGKAKVLRRYRDRMFEFTAALDRGSTGTGATDTARLGLASGDGTEMAPPLVSRMVLAAQEDLRREIARAMHDGPAQSLTNIVLQAQIVDHLLDRDPEQARSEVKQLMSMVQQTLEATKSFIFDVRPMVLDDLGLVPTLRRAARDRGRRAQIPVEFDSLGPDRRLPMELESGLFRLLDETLAAFLAGRPDRVVIKLDWEDRLEARVIANRNDPATPAGPTEGVATPIAEENAADAKRAAKAASKAADKSSARSGGKAGAGDAPAEMLPALAAMIEDRRADSSAAAAEVARLAVWVPLAVAAWREIQGRAATLGISAELLGDGTEVRLVAELPALASEG
jgi:two-component system, NarL family, sensor histidine kinase DegS